MTDLARKDSKNGGGPRGQYLRLVWTGIAHLFDATNSIMESLSLGGHYLHRNDPIRSRTYQPGYRPPCLPTPEPSRSSFEAGESKNQSGFMQKDRIDNAAWEIPRESQPPQVNGFRASSSSHLASRKQAAPQSPPYEMSDEQRPSLPPLKTVGTLTTFKPIDMKSG